MHGFRWTAGTFDLRAKVAACLGLALLEAWSQTLFSSRFALPLMENLLSAEAIHLAGSLAVALGALGWFATASRRRPIVERQDLLWVLGAIGALSSGGLIALGMMGGGEGALSLILNAIISLCGLGLLLGWCEMLSQDGALGAIVLMGFSAVAGSILYGLLNMTPLPAAAIVTVLLPLGTVAVLRWLPMREATASASMSLPPTMWRFQLPWLILVALASLAAGVVIAADMGYQADREGIDLLRDTLSRIAVMAAAVAIASLSLGSKRMIGGFFASLISMTAACVMMTFALHPFEGAASMFIRIGAEAMRYLVLGLVMMRASSALGFLDRSLALVFAFQFLGTAIGQGVVALSGNHGFLGVVLLIDLIGCAMAVMAAQGVSASPRANGGVRMDGQDEDALGRFAGCYGLSPREREVLALWVTGHASTRIEEVLGISKHTVKTHVQNIYAKTGVKTKQDLILLYEHEDQWNCITR